MTPPASPAPKSRSWRKWRPLAWALLVLVVLPAFAVGLLDLSLRSETVRKIFFEAVAARIEPTAGIGLEARDYSLSLLGGSLEIDELRVRSAEPGSRSSRAPWPK